MDAHIPTAKELIEQGEKLGAIVANVGNIEKNITEIKNAQNQQNNDIQSIQKEIAKANGAFNTIKWLFGGAVLVLFVQPFLKDIFTAIGFVK